MENDVAEALKQIQETLMGMQMSLLYHDLRIEKLQNLVEGVSKKSSSRRKLTDSRLDFFK